MRRTFIGSRWTTLGHRYAGGWRQNPWINAVCTPLHTGNEAGDSSTGSIDIDSAAEREPAGQTGPSTSQRHDSNQEQRAAVRTWENEGGSLGPHLT
jgi:hypothetical protein